MAGKHEVSFSPPPTVLRSPAHNIELDVSRNGEPLGRLWISKGGIKWLKPYDRTGSQFRFLSWSKLIQISKKPAKRRRSKAQR